MELVKQNENYTLKDTLENGWYTNGNVAYDVNGMLSFWANISKEDGSPVGNIQFTRPAEGNINITYDAAEENIAELSNYTNTLRDFIVSQFK
jgi:hypothetical protein